MACIMPAKSIVVFVVLAVMSPSACWNPPVGYVPGSPKLRAKPAWPAAPRCSFGYGGRPTQLQRENEQLRKKNRELSAELYAKELETELLYAAQQYTNDAKKETNLRKEVQSARWLENDTFIVLYKLV